MALETVHHVVLTPNCRSVLVHIQCCSTQLAENTVLSGCEQSLPKMNASPAYCYQLCAFTHTAILNIHIMMLQASKHMTYITTWLLQTST